MLCPTLVAWTPAHALAAAADAAPTPPRDHQAHAWRMVTRLRQGPRVACAPPVHHFSPSSDATRPPRSQTAALGPRSRLRPPPSPPFGLDRARDGATSLGWGLTPSLPHARAAFRRAPLPSNRPPMASDSLRRGRPPALPDTAGRQCLCSCGPRGTAAAHGEKPCAPPTPDARAEKGAERPLIARPPRHARGVPRERCPPLRGDVGSPRGPPGERLAPTPENGSVVVPPFPPSPRSTRPSPRRTPSAPPAANSAGLAYQPVKKEGLPKSRDPSTERVGRDADTLQWGGNSSSCYSPPRLLR